MSTRRWVRLAMVTALAVGGTLAVTAAPAQAMPRRCTALFDKINLDWDQFYQYVWEARINQHDGNWSDYVENMQMASTWAINAQGDTAAAERAGCF